MEGICKKCKRKKSLLKGYCSDCYIDCKNQIRESMKCEKCKVKMYVSVSNQLVCPICKNKRGRINEPEPEIQKNLNTNKSNK